MKAYEFDDHPRPEAPTSDSTEHIPDDYESVVKELVKLREYKYQRMMFDAQTERRQLAGEAVAKAMGEIKEVEKDSYNKFQKYDYASADSVFRACREAISKAGICITMKQIACKYEKIGDGDKIYINTVFAMSCENGYNEEQIHMLVPFLGPQSVQAARTYALKYYLRTKFLLPTGERDADDNPAFQDGFDPIEPADDKQKQETMSAVASANEIITAASKDNK